VEMSDAQRESNAAAARARNILSTRREETAA
jgi:hypothetical protein